MARAVKQENFQQRFINDISHELRTPLTIIRGYIDMLERYGADDPELFAEAITEIKKSSQNMQNLVESLLFLARADLGHQPLNKIAVDLDKLLKKIVEEYRTPRLQIIKSEPCRIMGDAEYLKKMFGAFFDNALKYSKQPVKAELTTTKTEAKIKIIDNGIGIHEEDLEKIFERFYRTDKARTKPSDNTSSVGLGLSVAKWIADNHGIKISVKSKFGQGTTITLTIPTI